LAGRKGIGTVKNLTSSKVVVETEAAIASVYVLEAAADQRFVTVQC